MREAAPFRLRAEGNPRSTTRIDALVVAVAAFMRTGGMQEIRHTTGTARDRTADLLDRLERVVRSSEEKPSARKPDGTSTN